MEAVAALNWSASSQVFWQSSRRGVASRGGGAAERPLSSFLCGGCLKAWRHGPPLARKAFEKSADEHSSGIRKRQSIEASAVLSGNEVIPIPVIPVAGTRTKVELIHSKAGLDSLMRRAKDQLVVVEYGTSESEMVKQIHPALVTLATSCPDVKFALVLGDESKDTERLMDDADVKTIPHFVFYKNGEKIHEESGIDENTLTGDVLYYGQTSSQVVDIHNQADLDRLLETAEDKLVVLDLGLKYCGPCVKVYPTVVKLARKMAGFAVFARVMGDENEWCQELLQKNKVIEVPTFIFLKENKQQARYVGSSRGSLIGEILKLQGACQ